MADSIEAELLPVRSVYEELVNGSRGLQKQMWEVTAESGVVARHIAAGKMETVKHTMGFMSEELLNHPH